MFSEVIKSKYAICAIAGFVFSIFLSYLVIYQGFSELQKEDGLIENLQALLLLLACFFYTLSATRNEGRDKVLCAFFAVLSFLFIIREIDFERIDGIPEFAVFMLAEKGRALFYSIQLVLLIMVCRDFKFYWQKKSVYITSPMIFFLCICAPGMLVFSFLLDREIWVIKHHVLFEELAEINAYFFILLSSLSCRYGYEKLKHRLL